MWFVGLLVGLILGGLAWGFQGAVILGFLGFMGGLLLGGKKSTPGQTAAPAPQDRVSRLEQRIVVLERRVQQLERRQHGGRG
jgi:hypothetical protein